MSAHARHSLLPLASAIFAATAFVLTEIALGFYAVEPLLVIIGGNLAGGGVMLLMSANNLSGLRLVWQWRTLATIVAGALFIYFAFFTVMFQAGVARLDPTLGVQLPSNLTAALMGGTLIAVGIIILQTDPAKTVSWPQPEEEQKLI